MEADEWSNGVEETEKTFFADVRFYINLLKEGFCDSFGYHSPIYNSTASTHAGRIDIWGSKR